jgi:hypothetical protein
VNQLPVTIEQVETIQAFTHQSASQSASVSIQSVCHTHHPLGTSLGAIESNFFDCIGFGYWNHFIGDSFILVWKNCFATF